jgi:CRISPR-associated protein Csm4
MDTRIVKLAFSAPVHFGDGRLSGSGFACDAATLFSALFIEALRLGRGDDLLEAARSGGFAISNVFPYVGDTLYLPRPMLEVGGNSDAGDPIVKKAFKKLNYVSAEHFGDYLAGRLNPLTELDEFKLGKPALQTKVNLTRESKNDADPFHVGGFSFYDGAGLYFLLQGAFDIEPLLDQLQYSGLGGERSSGYGRFHYQLSDGTLRVNSQMPSNILLSSAAPTREELTDDLLNGARYLLERKSGFVQSQTHNANPQKKRDFYVFVAGSAFPRRFAGDVFDVNATPGAHPVYRYARAMWMEV